MTRHDRQGFLLPLLAAIGGVLLSLVVWGRSSDLKQSLQQQYESFVSLAPDDQAAVRRSFEDFRSQSSARQAEIEEIHSEVANNPLLQKTLDDFFGWWTALPQLERDQFKDLAAGEKLAFIEAQTAKQNQLRSDITINFPGEKSPMFPRLHMSFDEYLTIIDEALMPFEKPESLLNDLDELHDADQKALRLTTWVFLEYLPASRDGDQLRLLGDQFADALQANVKDRSWAEKFGETRSANRDRRFGDSWLRLMSFLVIDRSTLALGQSLQSRFPVSDNQIVDAFADMKDESLQFDLMKMPAEEARTRLQLLAQSSGGDTALQRLLSQYNQFSAQRARLMRIPMGQGNPFGPGGPNGPGNRNPPPGFRGSRGEEKRNDDDRPDHNQPLELPPGERPDAEFPKSPRH